MNKKLTILSIATATVLFTGCGGGGGGGYTPVTVTTKTISGNVIDPEISNARVLIRCGSSTFNSTSVTNENGYFSISVPKDKNYEGCTIESTGGVDGGDNLDGITLKTQYDLYGKDNSILITPFTHAVAMHNSNDIETAKQEVANFYGVSKDDLLKNPINEMRLLKIAKKMTKLATKKDNNNKPIGYVDIDDSTSETTFDNYVTNDFSNNSNIPDKEKNDITDEFSNVDNANSKEDIIKFSIYDHAYYYIKNAYKKSSYTALERKNIRYMAQQIAEANKEVNNGVTTYKKVSSFRLKKAFLDLDLHPSFSDPAGVVLDTDINTKLNQSETAFKAYVDAKTIEISNTISLVVIDSKKNKKTLNNNSERISYYAFSDKSNLAKAVEITKNTFNDSVTQPVNTQISVGLANLGLKEDALENMNDNVHTRSGKISGYKELGLALEKLGYNTEALTAYNKYYENVLEEITVAGKEYISNSNLTHTLTAARKMAVNGDQKRADEIVEELKSYNKVLSSAVSYTKVPQALKDLAQATYVQSNDIPNAKKFAIEAGEQSIKTPTDRTSTAVFTLVGSALYSSIFDEHKYTEALLNNTSFDTSKRYLGKNTSIYQNYYTVALGLGENYVVAKNAFDSLPSNKKDDAINNGFAGAMMLHNKADELFANELIPSRFTRGIDDLFKYLLPVHEVARFSSAQIIHVRGENAKLEDFLDRLRLLIKRDDWVNDATQSDLSAAYGKWTPGATSSQGSFVQIAKWYKTLNKEDKARETILEAYAGLNALTDLEYKAEGLTDLLVGLNDTNLIDLLNTTQINNIVSSLNDAALHADMTDKTAIGLAANWLSFYDRKTEAKTLADKVYSLLDSKNNGHLTTVKNRIKHLVGIYNSAPRFSYSAAGTYFQSGNIDKTKEMIQEALDDANSLVESTDQYKLLIDIANAYAGINDYKTAATIISRIKTSKELDLAKVQVAKSLANYDAFINTKAASVDSDNDGKPDFWNVGASADDISKSNLTLDDDIDNDGIPEPTDELPYDGVN